MMHDGELVLSSRVFCFLVYRNIDKVHDGVMCHKTTNRLTHIRKKFL